MGALCCHLVPINSSLVVLIIGGLNPPPQKKNIWKQKLIFEKNVFLTLMLINFLKCKSHYIIFLPGNIFPLCSRLTQILILSEVFNHKLFRQSFFQFSFYSMSYTYFSLTFIFVIFYYTQHLTCASEDMFPLPKIPFSPLTI